MGDLPFIQILRHLMVMATHKICEIENVVQSLARLIVPMFNTYVPILAYSFCTV